MLECVDISRFSEMGNLDKCGKSGVIPLFIECPAAVSEVPILVPGNVALNGEITVFCGSLILKSGKCTSKW